MADGTRTHDAQIHNLVNTPEISEENAVFPKSAAPAQRAAAANVVFDPNLAAVMRAWPGLPEAVKRQVVAMTEAVAGGDGTGKV